MMVACPIYRRAIVPGGSFFFMLEHWACSSRGYAMDFSDIEDPLGEPESFGNERQAWLLKRLFRLHD